MAKPLASYNPADVTVSVGGGTITGFADGTFVLVAMDEDAFTKQQGADGEGGRSKSNNYGGSITITLMQTSDGNDILSSLALADRLTSAGLFPIMVKDSNGRSLAVAENAWVRKSADAEYGKELGSREWVIDTDNLQSFVGGI